LNQHTQHIEWIPISEIRIANPRARNKVTFQNIVVNIGNVGLKKPITVCRREPAPDGTAYDLACGQGRIEALAALGGTKVPAIVIEANKEQRHLMSLVENIARRRPSNTELVREVRNLTERGYTPSSIAEKLGLHITYIHNVVRLLRKGEDRLIAEVEAGTLPISVAVKIAGASSKAVQQALNDAYESGDLRGGKFRAVQKLITQRFSKKHSDPAKPTTVSSKDIVREYQKQTQRQVALVQRAAIVAQRLALLRSAMKRLLGDDHFVTLLRAESLDRLPEVLARRSA